MNQGEKVSIECAQLKRDMEKNEDSMKNFFLVERWHDQIQSAILVEDQIIQTVFSDINQKVKNYISEKKKKEKEKENAAIEFSYLKRYVKRSTWSRSKLHPSLTITRNGTRVNSSSYGWKTIFSNQLLDEGDYLFEVELTKFRKKQLSTIGILNPQQYYRKYGNNFEHEIGYIGFCLDLSSGDKLYKGKLKKYIKPIPRQGDIIGVIVNFNTRQVSFTLNGTKFGVAFCSKFIKPPLCLVLSCFLTNQKFTLLQPKV